MFPDRKTRIKNCDVVNLLITWQVIRSCFTSFGTSASVNIGSSEIRLRTLNPTAQKDNRGVLGASFLVEEFSEIVGYSNMADYTFSGKDLFPYLSLCVKKFHVSVREQGEGGLRYGKKSLPLVRHPKTPRLGAVGFGHNQFAGYWTPCGQFVSQKRTTGYYWSLDPTPSVDQKFYIFS